ncbi:IclR family transcriptional regulator [Bremerella alba]|uniref:Pectin degradation repressor protein KdgR n=1 Tax=Bremerella alba TaxID=980252 RepID=A0A7V9A7D6_9BACT|nr:IclR family transcriptional regulator [Bremerella alba]MBA2115247.1 Pectin degradation repressor protein KdgR [Bremerella alba]
MISKNDTLDQRYHVPSLVRALQIFEFLASEPESLGISEISTRLSLPKNSVFRILTTLADYGYLNREPVQKRYVLSRKLLALGYAAIDEANLVERSLGPMRNLRDVTQESVLIGTLSNHRGVVLEQLPSPQPIKVMVEIGHSFPLHSAAPGKAILAYLEETHRKAIVDSITFEKLTNRTITKKSDYYKELALVARQGFALDQGEEVDEIHCIAAPIFNRRCEPIASIWVTGPKTRLTKNRFPKVRSAVMEQAQVISKRLGWDTVAPAIT